MPLGSFAVSRLIDPIAFVGKLPETNCHFTSGWSALSVNQIPPPAAASSSWQSEFEQSGFSDSAVIRPDAW